MKATTRIESESGSGRKGLQFTMIEEVEMSSESKIYDAEGVSAKAGDRIEFVLQSERVNEPARVERRFGRIVEVRATDPRDTIKPPTVFVRFDDDARLRELAPEIFENFCRILVDVDGEPTPAGAVAGTGEPPAGWERDGSAAVERSVITFYGIIEDGVELAVGDTIYGANEFGTPDRAEVTAIRVWGPEEVAVEIRFGNGYVKEISGDVAEAAVVAERGYSSTIVEEPLFEPLVLTGRPVEIPIDADYAIDRFGNEIRVGDDVRFRILGDPERDEVEDRGRVARVEAGSILVMWGGNRGESVVPARGVQKHVELVKSRS